MAQEKKHRYVKMIVPTCASRFATVKHMIILSRHNLATNQRGEKNVFLL